MKKKYPSYGSLLETDIPLPHIDGERSRFVALLEYQIPKRIRLHGRRKASPRFDTLYGMLYWLEKREYNMQFIIFCTKKHAPLYKGKKLLNQPMTLEKLS